MSPVCSIPVKVCGKNPIVFEDVVKGKAPAYHFCITTLEVRDTLIIEEPSRILFQLV